MCLTRVCSVRGTRHMNRSSALREHTLSLRGISSSETEYLRMGYVSRWRHGCTFRIRKTSWGRTFQVLKEVMAGATWTLWAADWENTSTRVYTKKILRNSKTSRVSSVWEQERSQKRPAHYSKELMGFFVLLVFKGFTFMWLSVFLTHAPYLLLSLYSLLIYLFLKAYFMCTGVLPACTQMHHMCACCIQRWGIYTLELDLQVALSHHVGACWELNLDSL